MNSRPIGWPTYQQGRAGELFFRIDPDGYARFGHGDRLDQDYWEVTCTPDPPDCTARRGPVRLSVISCRASAGCPPAGTRAVSPGMPDSPALTFAKCSVLQSWPRPTIAKQTLLRSLRGLSLLPFSCFASRSAGGAGGAMGRCPLPRAE